MAAGFTRPYVDALLSVAGSSEAVAALLPDLERFSRTLAAAADLRELLRNPAVDRATKAALLDAVAARLEMGSLPARLLRVLLANRRLTHLAEVIAAIRERLDREKNVVEARVRSARPLESADAEALRKALEGQTRRRVRLVPEVDSSLLGGFVVRVGSEVYDASLSTRLARVRAAFREGTHA